MSLGYADALVMPGMRARTFSTRLTQEAQVIPLTARSIVSAMGSGRALMRNDKGIMRHPINAAPVICPLGCHSFPLSVHADAMPSRFHSIAPFVPHSPRIFP